MGPLIAGAIGLVPVLLDALAGKRAGEVAGRVVDVVREVTGSDDPAAIANLPPERRAELQERLVSIALEERRAELADIADARAQTVTLAQSGSLIAWGAPLVSVAVLSCWAWSVVAPTLGAIPLDAGDKNIVEYSMIAVLGYWIGSSQGSKRSGDAVREMAVASARAAPQPVAIATTGPVSADSLNDASLARARAGQ